MSRCLLAVDVGKRACGCSLWEHGKLIGAKLVRARDQNIQTFSLAVEEMARAVCLWTFGIISTGYDLNAVIELPQTYGGRAKHGDANVLIELAVVVGAIQRSINAPTSLIWPHEWKGSIPKKDKVSAENVIKNRALEKLSMMERVNIELPGKSLEHNVYDAIGIGLWALKR